MKTSTPADVFNERLRREIEETQAALAATPSLQLEVKFLKALALPPEQSLSLFPPEITISWLTRRPYMRAQLVGDATGMDQRAAFALGEKFGQEMQATVIRLTVDQELHNLEHYLFVCKLDWLVVHGAHELWDRLVNKVLSAENASTAIVLFIESCMEEDADGVPLFLTPLDVLKTIDASMVYAILGEEKGIKLIEAILNQGKGRVTAEIMLNLIGGIGEFCRHLSREELNRVFMRAGEKAKLTIPSLEAEPEPESAHDKPTSRPPPMPSAAPSFQERATDPCPPPAASRLSGPVTEITPQVSWSSRNPGRHSSPPPHRATDPNMRAAPDPLRPPSAGPPPPSVTQPMYAVPHSNGGDTAQDLSAGGEEAGTPDEEAVEFNLTDGEDPAIDAPPGATGSSPPVPAIAQDGRSGTTLPPSLGLFSPQPPIDRPSSPNGRPPPLPSKRGQVS